MIHFLETYQVQYYHSLFLAVIGEKYSCENITVAVTETSAELPDMLPGAIQTRVQCCLLAFVGLAQEMTSSSHSYIYPCIGQLHCLIFLWMGIYQYLDIDVYFKCKTIFGL